MQDYEYKPSLVQWAGGDTKKYLFTSCPNSGDYPYCPMDVADPPVSILMLPRTLGSYPASHFRTCQRIMFTLPTRGSLGFLQRESELHSDKSRGSPVGSYRAH